jgi:flagellar hook protein FlgE
MFIATTGLNAFSNSINVAGDNIANLQTVGFKTSRLGFADLLPTITGDIETGHGVTVDASKPFQQGAFETTPNVTDLGIEGNGFFTVKDADTGTSYYTRAGQFHLDSTGTLVNDSGLRLQGSAGDIAIGNSLTNPAQATTGIALSLNLQASASTPAAGFPAGPDASSSAWTAGSNYSSVMTIYDAQGTVHDLTFFFRKTAPNTWEYRIAARRSELDASSPNSADLREVSAPGTLEFTANGQLDAAASTVTDISGLNWINGAVQTISANNLNFTGTVQYDQASALLSASQDGLAQGELSGFTIDGEGVITGRFSNGTSRVLDVISLANFANVDDLDPQGDTLFLPSAESGGAQSGTPGQGGLGNIMSGALELSTVDLAHEFVSLIASQRAFQMSSRVITTADQMYTVAANLKS